MNLLTKIVLAAGLVLVSGTVYGEDVDRAVDESRMPRPEELEAKAAIIGKIIFEKENVFDTSNPAENNALYRLANYWHIMTRDSVIRHQLLFKPGDVFSKRMLEESERLLRQNVFLHDARIEPLRYSDGVVDIRVSTRDLWTLVPSLSLSRSGGENRFSVSLSEKNLLGHGIALSARYSENVDRKSTTLSYFDRNLGRTWASLYFGLADNSDGQKQEFRLIRPFYHLDARWSAGTTFQSETSEVSYYDLGNEGAEYAMDRNFHTGFIGWSAGLQNGWTRRWTAGVVYDDNQFSEVADGTLPAIIPEDRKLVYPYIGVELLEDRFESASNRDSMDRTEDFYLGTRLWASVGYASEDLGADRKSVLYRFEASGGFGSMENKALLVSSSFAGRFDDAEPANTEISVTARYYNQISEKRLFYATLEASAGENLDLDNLVDLGGDTGLRGYPLRYQTGDTRLLVSVEQRYYTDWYPFRLFRVGGAAFADIGRVWGENPLGSQPLGWLKDIGIGLRLVPTRASGRDVIHIDIAFPLDGDPTIDNVQFLIQSKRSF
jgi:outer membrane protein assembly factor BamA